MILTTLNVSIEVLLSGTVTTNQLQLTADWIDLPYANFESGRTTTETNDATAVTLVPACQDNKRRNVSHISIYNSDTAAATVTIRYNVSSVYTTIVKVTLGIGYGLYYNGINWQMLSPTGAIVTTVIASTTVPDGTYGDITVSGGGTIWTIDQVSMGIDLVGSIPSGVLLVNGSGNLDEMPNTGAATDFFNGTGNWSAIQSASETVSGILEIATQAETNTGTDDARAVTPLKLKTAGDLRYQPLDSDLTSISGLTPSNDDIIQRKVGAWTNRTIGQYYTDLQPSVKADGIFVITMYSGTFSPLDATTYYYIPGASGVSTTQTNREMIVPVGITLFSASIDVLVAGTLGSADDVPVVIRIDNTTDYTIKTDTRTTATNQHYVITGLNQAIAASSRIQIKSLMPTFGTNPTNVIYLVNLYFRYT